MRGHEVSSRCSPLSLAQLLSPRCFLYKLEVIHHRVQNTVEQYGLVKNHASLNLCSRRGIFLIQTLELKNLERLKNFFMKNSNF